MKVLESKISFTQEEIANALQGYFCIHQDLYDFIPKGSYIRYFKRGTEPIGDRFKLGGYIKSRTTYADGAKAFLFENKLYGAKNTQGYVVYSISYNDIDELWKRYNYDSFIELHLIQNSLAKKNSEIEQLRTEIASLMARVVALERRK